jgi:transcriptional regulator with XRE-family HTH domain
VNQLLDRLRGDLQNEDARYGYADSVTNAFIAAQIRTLREERELNQEELANRIGTKQSGISRLERVDYSAWKVDTLRRLARAFGVRLHISFEEFGTLVDELREFTKERLAPRSFDNDPVFKEGWEPRRTRRKRRLNVASGRQPRRRLKYKAISAPRKEPGLERERPVGTLSFSDIDNGSNCATVPQPMPKGGNESSLVMREAING